MYVFLDFFPYTQKCFHQCVRELVMTMRDENFDEKRNSYY